MINAAHIHLMLNTVPPIVTLVAIAVLLWGFVRKNEEVLRVALMMLVAVALVTIVVFRTGDPAILVVGELSGVSLPAIGDHQELAKRAIWLVEITGAAALAGLVAFRSPRVMPKWFVGVILLLSLASGAIVLETCRVGGGIRHPETQTGQENLEAP